MVKAFIMACSLVLGNHVNNPSSRAAAKQVPLLSFQTHPLSLRVGGIDDHLGVHGLGRRGESGRHAGDMMHNNLRAELRNMPPLQQNCSFEVIQKPDGRIPSNSRRMEDQLTVHLFAFCTPSRVRSFACYPEGWCQPGLQYPYGIKEKLQMKKQRDCVISFDPP